MKPIITYEKIMIKRVNVKLIDTPLVNTITKKADKKLINFFFLEYTIHVQQFKHKIY